MSNRNPLPRPSTPPGAAPSENHQLKSKLSFGVVCSSNINRSMEAHLVLGNAGLRVESYGTGTQVRLPGKTAMEPKIFKFGTPYEHMYQNLALDDTNYFTRNGVLQLCRRGAAVKKAPNRWQDTPVEVLKRHSVIIAFEERIYDAVIEDLQIREPTEDFQPLHVICLDTRDNPEEAAKQSLLPLHLYANILPFWQKVCFWQGVAAHLVVVMHSSLRSLRLLQSKWDSASAEKRFDCIDGEESVPDDLHVGETIS